MNEQLFNKLKSASDSMEPLTHDGSYTLLRKAVWAYANLRDYKTAWKELDYNDLNLLLHLVIGTWKQNIEIKKQSVDKSHLLDLDKSALKSEIDEVWNNALSNMYQNIEGGKASIGMFGTGFYSFETKTDKESVKRFIGLLVDIYFKAGGYTYVKDLNENNEYYDMAAEVLNNGVRGMGAASVSQILHCLQPYIFPVLNSASKEFYSSWKLKGITKIENYIDNCRKINTELLSHGIKVFNYRILDIEAIKVKSDYQQAFEVWLGRQNELDRGEVARYSEAVLSSTDLVEEPLLKGGTIYSEKNIGAVKTCIEHIESTLQGSEQDDGNGFVIDSLNRYKDFLSYIEECKTGNDILKFKNLLKWFVKQIRINNGIIEGEHTSGQGYKGKGLRDKYIDFHQYNGFTLDCSIQSGLQKRSKANYIHLTEARVNICPVFKKAFDNKSDVAGLQIEIKPDNNIERTYSEIKMENLDLFSEDAANDSIKELFALLKNEIDTYQYYNNSADKLKQDNKDKGEKMKSQNLILYGPPGTGKTFHTMAYAVAIIERRDFNDVKVEANEDYSKVKDRYENYKKKGLIDFVTFHQSYGYEEFVQGIKPVTKNGSISYEVQDGIFKKFCDNAKKDKNSSYVFIIDEINRGNISKIFGELITLIEDTKREGADEEMKVTLPYIDKEGQPVSFSVPQNVYIIGTMNTADRSIAAMDTALRRRFQFEEMMPKAELLEGIQIIDQSGNDTKINVQSILETINRRIEALYDREHTIGHAYFMPLRESGTLEKLADIFKTKIIPLLQEYFYDDYEKIRLVLGDNQKKDDRQFVSKKEVNNTQLFGEGVDELLSDNRYTYEIKSAVFGSPDAYRYIYESDRTSVKVEE